MTQQEALAILESGQSVLLTGAAGTGKTYILNQFIKRARYRGMSVAVTATTGLAATHLNGTTIHAWSGIGIYDELKPGQMEKLGKQRQDLINKADILVIDEISMFHDFRLDMIDAICRKVRSNPDKPFGGLQVILCGDFFQLPPVNRNDAKQGSFITGSDVWQQNNFSVCYLLEQKRQKDDQHYTDILNGIRAGALTKNQLNDLLARQKTTIDPWTPMTRLLTTNANVDIINQQHLNKLQTKSVFYDMQTHGSKKFIEQLQKSCLAPEVLELKAGALVMCIKNSQDKKYVNGSLGIVENFDKETNYPKIKLNNGNLITIKPETWELVDGDKVRGSLTQLPLRLAWAITVHKSQGMTLDAARIDLSNAFVEGMGYVALSRVKGMDMLVLDGINRMALMVSPEAKRIDNDLRQNSLDTQTVNQEIIKKWLASEDLNKNIPEPKPKKIVNWNDKLIKMREEYPNAYMPWQEKDDRKLVKQFSSGKTIEQLSVLLGRHQGSIKSRLKKHLGDDIFDI